MQAKLRSTVAAMMLLAPVAASFVAQPAQAATRPAAPSITNMSLNSDAGLSAGATLRVQLQATPDARRASITLGDSGVTVPLRQHARGKYSGTYVVRRSDHIDPMQAMTARVTFGKRTYSRSFNFPPSFQALAMGNNAQPTAPARPVIERFVMRSSGPLEPGRELRFRVRGAPGGDAWLDIPGVINGVDLAEVRPGVYEGAYTVRRRDDPDAFRSAIATLRNGSQRATSRVELNARDEDWEVGRDDGHGRDRDRDHASGPLRVHVTSYSDNAVVDANGKLAIRGRTAPFANVRVQVDSVATVPVPGMPGLAQQVADQTVQADRDGEFHVLVSPRGLPIPGTRYDVHLTATSGSQTAEERLTLYQRHG